MSALAADRILPDPSQIQAADPRQSVFVTANAGSGKTSTLVDRVARLLLEEVQPAEILCVTYTKAAAAEMQARLFDRLGNWAVMDDAALSHSLADLDGREASTLSGTDLSKARRLFAKALETPGGLKIQTVHAFCEKLLKRFPLEAGVSPTFKVLEDQAALELSHRAREGLALAARRDPEGSVGRAYTHFAVQMDWNSFEALLGQIEADRARLLDYIARVADGRAPGPHVLVGADPEEDAPAIEARFMTRLSRTEWLAMAEMMERGSVNDGKCAARMHSADWTFDGLGSVFLTKGGTPCVTMATKSAPAVAGQWLTALQGNYLSALSEIRAARIADDTVRVLTLAQAHGNYYEAQKSQHSALDFGDLVARTVELLTVRSTAAWVLYKLDGGIEHVLIDEAQDTAPEQWEIVRALTEGFFAGAGSVRFGTARVERTVFGVGDEKQSIYSFQGARPERLRQESQRYDALVTGAGRIFKGIDLLTSFRSTPEVLKFVDAVFEGPERIRALVGPEVAAMSAHVPKRLHQHGCIDIVKLYTDDPKAEPEAWTAPVDQESASSARKRMAADLASDIKRQIETGVAVHERKGGALRPCRYGDFLILVRRRDPTFEEIIRALKTAGVPVAGADRLKLSSHIVFDDLIACARFALFPDDDLSLAGLLRSPLCDVDEDSLFALAGARADRGKLWRELRDRADERPDWRQAHDLAAHLLDTRARDPFAFFSGILNRVDQRGLSGRGRIANRLGREAEEAIDETLNQVLAAEGRGGTDLETCLAMLEAADVEVKREMDAAGDQVRVMTVHGAKGLEAPIVILPDTTTQAKPKGGGLMAVTPGPEFGPSGEAWLMCPSAEVEDCDASAAARQLRKARANDESLRLLYVALTRARDRIVIMGRAKGNSNTGFDEGSWWDVLSDTFDRADLGARDLGDGRRRIGPDPAILGMATDAKGEADSLPDWARRLPSPDAGARYASPSRMDEAIRLPAPSPLATLGTAGASLGRFRRGDLIHGLLERLPELAADDRPAAAARMLSREPGLTDDQRTEMIDAAFRVLDDPVFAPVFGAGSRAEVALTGTAPDLPAGVRISGRMDRLVVAPDRVLVVDYKTNRPAPARIEDADPGYVRQLAVYVAVLRRLYPDRAVEAALVWTDGPRLMPVPQFMLDAALAPTR